MVLDAGNIVSTVPIPSLLAKSNLLRMLVADRLLGSHVVLAIGRVRQAERASEEGKRLFEVFGRRERGQRYVVCRCWFIFISTSIDCAPFWMLLGLLRTFESLVGTVATLCSMHIESWS